MAVLERESKVEWLRVEKIDFLFFSGMMSFFGWIKRKRGREETNCFGFTGGGEGGEERERKDFFVSRSS